ncbi:MAG TPA: hypothetical protein VMY98_08745 [Anaerolineae bacterium]|nr:hypothetical protein [Anaerolineae bacterium]
MNRRAALLIIMPILRAVAIGSCSPTADLVTDRINSVLDEMHLDPAGDSPSGKYSCAPASAANCLV